jgi:hypothetical protein
MRTLSSAAAGPSTKSGGRSAPSVRLAASASGYPSLSRMTRRTLATTSFVTVAKLWTGKVVFASGGSGILPRLHRG